jgi:predicted metal-dependent hydrolase
MAGTETLQPSLPFDAGSPRYEFVRHPRARRYVIRVVGDGTVRVTVPRRGSKREAEAFAEREREWIEKQQRRVEAERERRERETRNGGSAAADHARVGELTGDQQRALRERARRELPQRLLELAAQHRLTVTRVTVRNQRWRWGSCNRNGHICLNWRLVEMPDAVRDYVLLHELMHLKRMDHSPKFWKLVGDVCPDFRTARAWLKTFSRGAMQNS